MFVLPLMFIAAARAAHPFPFPGESLEWDVADSDLVVRGVVTSADAAPPLLGGQIVNGQPTLLLITIDVRETLKGSARQHVQFLYSPGGWNKLPAKPDGREWLICLNNPGRAHLRIIGPKGIKTVPPHPGPSGLQWDLDHWRRRIFPVQSPWPLINGRSMFPPETIDAQWVQGPEQILQIAREECQAEPAQRPPIIWVRSRGDVGNLQLDVGMAVPADLRTERHALQWLRSGDDLQKFNAVSLLGWSRTETDVARLKAMLSDPTFVCIGEGPFRFRFFVIRDYAYGCLVSQGIVVDKPVVEETLCGYRQGGWPAIVAFALAVGALLGAAVWIRRECSKAARNRIRVGISSVALVFLIGIGLLSFRSGGQAVLTLLARHHLTLLRGSLQYVCTRNWPERSSLAVTTFPVSPWDEWYLDLCNSMHPGLGATNQLPASQYRQPAGLMEMAGAAVAYGTAGTPAGGMRTYFGFRISVFYLALLAAILPTRRSFRAIIERRRARRGLCPGCGFDLRASSERCPECGLAM
jgi:hypothetical protein